MDIQEALNKFEFMRANDVPLFDISRELGISMATLRRWEGDRKRTNARNSDSQTGDVSLSVNVDVWKDIGVVLSRLSIGVVICTLLFKAVGFVKAITIVLAGGYHF